MIGDGRPAGPPEVIEGLELNVCRIAYGADLVSAKLLCGRIDVSGEHLLSLYLLAPSTG